MTQRQHHYIQDAEWAPFTTKDQRPALQADFRDSSHGSYLGAKENLTKFAKKIRKRDGTTLFDDIKFFDEDKTHTCDVIHIKGDESCLILHYWIANTCSELNERFRKEHVQTDYALLAQANAIKKAEDKRAKKEAETHKKTGERATESGHASKISPTGSHEEKVGKNKQRKNGLPRQIDLFTEKQMRNNTLDAERKKGSGGTQRR